MVARVAWAFQGPCQDEGKRILDELIERWTWESFWDGGTSGFQYEPRTNANVDVFWNASFVGMCSLELGSCTSYERNDARLGQFAISTKLLRGSDLRQGTGMFLRGLNESRVIRQSNNPTSRRQPDNAGSFEHGGTVVSIPTPGREVVVQRNASGFQTCVVTNNNLPPLGRPNSIRNRITPDNLSAFEAWLKYRLHAGPVGTKSEYLIPYYAPTDPIVYLLIRVNGVTESVIFVLTKPSGTDWQIGGHFDPKESPTQIRRLAPLILSAKMTSVFR